MNQEAKAWMDKAIQDISSAKYLFETHYPKPLDTICYIAQQGAEKSVKAVFASINYSYGIPKSHDLVFLLNQIKNEVDFSDDMLKLAKVLTDFGVVFRYPDEMDNDENKTQLALKYSEEMYNWAKSIIEDK